LDDLGVDGMIILKRILKKWFWRVFPVLSGLRIRAMAHVNAVMITMNS
jgi:hypothetical protein